MNVQEFALNQGGLDNVFNFLTINELGSAARVCTRWKDLTNCCQKKKDAYKDLMVRIIESRVNSPNSKECYFICSMLDEEKATPRLISKFIRGESYNTCIIKAISLAKTITSEQITDALDTKRPKIVINLS